jgi:alkylhydroperoxidase/carboxymuconolactone decarboxylase family protein YurZ/AraC-like DNA-binding protein
MTDELASTRQGVLDGLAIYAGLRGTERAERMRRTVDSGDLGSTLMAMSMEFVFGQIWSRDVLDAKQRSLVTIGILIALRQTEELKNHVRIGLTNGLTVCQIEEATIQAAAYAGFPAAHAASNAIREALRDPSFAPPPRTGQSQYRALLASQTQSESETFDPLDRWMAEHVKEDLRVEVLAERIHMSPRNFARVYTKKRGCTPAKAVEAIRVEAARRRLEETEERIESVAEDAGFSSEEQMRCAFIRILGIPPREYRKRFATSA